MSQPLENYLPGVRDNGGLVTNEPVTINNTMTGQQQPIVNITAGTGTSATLTASQSGSFIVVNSTTGSRIALPAPTPGVYFEIVYLTAATGTHAVVTNTTSSVFMEGAVSVIQLVTNTTATFLANGTTHAALQMNGSTTAGTNGTYIAFVCAATNEWFVQGDLVSGSGALSSPFFTTSG